MDCGAEREGEGGGGGRYSEGGGGEEELHWRAEACLSQMLGVAGRRGGWRGGGREVWGVGG